MTPLQEARATGRMFYVGKVCSKHPELKGERRAKNGNCHKCICERMRARPSRKKPSAGEPRARQTLRTQDR